MKNLNQYYKHWILHQTKLIDSSHLFLKLTSLQEDFKSGT